MFSSGKEYKTTSSLDASQTPIAKAMFEILKADLARRGKKPYAGSAGSEAFNPRAVQQSFDKYVGMPMQGLWDDRFANLIAPDMQKYAQARTGETMAGLSSRAGLRGEEQAYAETLRIDPGRGQAMNLGQAFLGMPLQYMYQVPTREAEIVRQIDTGLSMAMAMFGAGTGQPKGQYDPAAGIQYGQMGPGTAGYSTWPVSGQAMSGQGISPYAPGQPNPWGQQLWP